MDRLIGFKPNENTSKFLIMGDGPQAAALLTQINDNKLSGRILVLGYQDNPFHSLLKPAFLLASHWKDCQMLDLKVWRWANKIATSTSGGLVDLCGAVSTDALSLPQMRRIS